MGTNSCKILIVGSSGGASAAKKAKTNTDGWTFQWEWEGDGGKWTAYAEDLSKTLTEAYKNEESQVNFTLVS